MSEFKKEQRYFVFKLKNLTQEQKQHLCDFEVEIGSHNSVGECVVVEADWPNYQDTWADIQAVSEGRFVSRSQLELQLEEASTSAATWENRCIAETCALREMTDERDALAAKNVEQRAFIESVMANIGAGATLNEVADMLCNWWGSNNPPQQS